jgi:hypothetical protein
MRAVWSFWSKPYRTRSGWTWREPLHHYLAWGLTLRLACRHYPETVLITDTAGKALLVERLELPFKEVSTELDRLRDVDPGWWALGKLIAYARQDRPFVHIDTDVFLWKPLPAGLIGAPVFTQCPEQHGLDEPCGPREVERAFAQAGLSLPAEWAWSASRRLPYVRQENTGILGGADTGFIRYYAELAIDLATNPRHAAAWAAAFPNKFGCNFLIEQFLLAACLEFHRMDPRSPFRGIAVRHLFSSFEQAFDRQEAARIGYTHLLAEAKSSAFVAGRLEQRMRQEDPAFYQHCVKLSRSAQLEAAGA